MPPNVLLVLLVTNFVRRGVAPHVKAVNWGGETRQKQPPKSKIQNPNPLAHCCCRVALWLACVLCDECFSVGGVTTSQPPTDCIVCPHSYSCRGKQLSHLSVYLARTHHAQGPKQRDLIAKRQASRLMLVRKSVQQYEYRRASCVSYTSLRCSLDTSPTPVVWAVSCDRYCKRNLFSTFFSSVAPNAQGRERPECPRPCDL